VNKAIENGIGVCWISDDLMPGRYRELTSDDGRTASVAIFEDFQEVMASLLVERLKTPIIKVI
jgi:hypothetical protein